mgnify:CR=1 FL=1
MICYRTHTQHGVGVEGHARTYSRLSTYPCSVLDNYRFDNQVKCWKFVIVIST